MMVQGSKYNIVSKQLLSAWQILHMQHQNTLK